MFYIPAEWVKNPGNIEKIHNILNKHYQSDLSSTDAPDRATLAIKELQAIGETIVIEKMLKPHRG